MKRFVSDAEIRGNLLGAPLTRRRLVGASLGLAGVGCAAMAGRTPGFSARALAQSAGEGVQGGMLRVGTIGEPPSFDPMFTSTTITRNIAWHVFETLYAPDSQYAPQPMLVASSEAQEDGKVLILRLREGVPFHNGDILNADDVIASLQRYGKLSSRGGTLFQRVAGLDKVDDLTVRMSFTEPTGIAPIFFQSAEAIIIPKEIADAAPDSEMGEFIGTGPFRFNERLADRYISVVRFDDYVSRDEPPNGAAGGRTAYFDEIRFIPVSEPAVRSDGLITDEFDFVEGISTDLYEALEAEPDIELQLQLDSFYGSHFNKSEQSMMRDPALRMALLTAVHMEPVATAGFGSEQFYRLGPEIAARETRWYTDAGKEFYDLNDPEKARQMLQEAGYDGTPIRWLSTTEYGYNYNMSLVLKEQMEAAGAVIDLQVIDWATLVSTRSQPDAWDLFTTGHPAVVHPATQQFLNETWPGFWSNPRKDELVTAMFREPDQLEHIAALQRLFWEEAVMINVCAGAGLSGYRSRLKGYSPTVDWFFWNAWFEE